MDRLTQHVDLTISRKIAQKQIVITRFFILCKLATTKQPWKGVQYFPNTLFMILYKMLQIQQMVQITQRVLGPINKSTVVQWLQGHGVLQQTRYV